MNSEAASLDVSRVGAPAGSLADNGFADTERQSHDRLFDRLFQRATLFFALLVLLNLIPVAGVAFLGWDAGYILLLYWAENLVMGGIALIRILKCNPFHPGGYDPVV